MSAAIEIFRQAASLNSYDARRKGNVVELGDGADVIVVGDLHGNRKALTAAIAYADLENHSRRCFVLQELLHGGLDKFGNDRSCELLLRAARLKVKYPEQVLFLLANHDIAQITGNEISKDGRGVCKCFSEGIKYAFGAEDAEAVEQAIVEFFLSQPLAIRCPNGVLIVHSLPSPARMAIAGFEILDRTYSEEDLHRGKPLYEWIWGRGQTPEQLKEIARRLDVQFFVLGHKHSSEGFSMIKPLAITLTSSLCSSRNCTCTTTDWLRPALPTVTSTLRFWPNDLRKRFCLPVRSGILLESSLFGG